MQQTSRCIGLYRNTDATSPSLRMMEARINLPYGINKLEICSPWQQQAGM
jgi:hypothetical protein